MNLCECGCGHPTAPYADGRGFARFLPGHHNRVWRRRENAKRTLIQRWCRHVRLPADPNACWEWTGTIDSNGYGRMKYCGKVIRAPRAAYEIFVGPIAERMQPDQKVG